MGDPSFTPQPAEPYEGEWLSGNSPFWIFQRVTRIDAFEVRGVVGVGGGWVQSVRVGVTECLMQQPELGELAIFDLGGKWARFRLPIAVPGQILQLRFFPEVKFTGEIRPLGVTLV